MRVGRGNFDEETIIADVGEISAVEVDEIFAHHWTDGDVAEWFEARDDLVFLFFGSGHVNPQKFLACRPYGDEC